jgi:S1-C subfamily serine protease
MSWRRFATRRSILLVPAAVLMLPFLGSADARAGLPDAVKRVKPSVVSVGTFQKTRSPPFLFRGTGFVVDDGTLVATNAHVVPDTLNSESGETIVVLVQVTGVNEPQAREIKSVTLDADHDLAVLHLAGRALPAVTLGDSTTVREGQTVAFTGFPIGHVLGFHAVTHVGIVSSLTQMAIPARTARQLDAPAIKKLRSDPVELFQLDATVYAGHSGSPLYNDSGDVIGVVNMGFPRGVKDPVLGQIANISFAVPARFLQDLIRSTR